VVFPSDDAAAIGAAARAHDVASYLDGARLFNAAIAGNRSPADVADPYDLVSVAFQGPGSAGRLGARRVA
jgi:threonine aldolase